MIKMDMGVDGLERFSRSVASQALGDVEVGTKAVARKILQKIVDRMPVKTGRARAGWVESGIALGVDVPAMSGEQLAMLGIGGSVPGLSQAGDSKYEERRLGSDFELVMTNGVPYVIYLEYGLSPQAPLGMVRVSILEVAADDSVAKALENQLKQSWQSLSVSERYQMHANIFGSL